MAEAINRGATACLRKPADADQILEALGNPRP
jgi:ActR/RegA family two-component response regulator